MNTQLFLILLIALVAVIYVSLAVAAFIRMRGARIVVCPETDRPAAVSVDAGHAALSAVFEKREVELNDCSRWPERKNCNQACTGQISVAPKETLVFEVLRRWYAGKTCAICKNAIPPLHAVGPKPGMLNVASGASVVLTWEEIPAQDLPEAFKTHLPVCSHCQIAEVFRRQFPDLVIDRHDSQNRTTIH